MRRCRRNGGPVFPIIAVAFGAGLVIALCLSFKTVAFIAAIAFLVVAIALLRYK